jgi:acyl dehydratase
VPKIQAPRDARGEGEENQVSNAVAEKPEFMQRAVLWPKGNKIADFEEGREFQHHWGRTINEGDNSLFTTLTQMYNPIYFNEPYARAAGHERLVVAPLLVFNTVLGMSVEDLSLGGPFVGINDCVFHQPVYVGDTLSAKSTVVERRFSKSRPGSAIVTWRTEGRNQDGELVISYTRSNLLTDLPE